MSILRDTAIDMAASKVKFAEELWAAPKFTDDQWAVMLAKREQHVTNQGLGGDP